MLPRLNRSILMLGSIGALVAGCAANPAVTAYDQYGNPISAYSANDPYGSSYGGSTGYDSGYGSTGYDTSYSGDTSGSYAGDTSSSGSYDDYGSTSGTTYGASPSPSPSVSPTPPPPSLDDRPVLSATLLEVKESGLLGMGKITAKVEVENPGNVTLSGKLRVLFTDHGDPTANAYVRKVTLHPKEKQQLTFTANAWRLDDAEVSIETDEQPASQSGAVN